ncbi:hypothetical protein ABT336_01965 [Micromonospora sp. NPDC000207]|uniref:hypothetical protein n=1 Tax=Micromonospora sp. NPDC000207 TaxID=3154246 RepID=UPI00331CD03C
MTQPKTNRIPAPIYAAAGVSDLAFEQLRKLPAVVTGLGGRVAADLGGKAVVTGFELRQKATETLRTANQTATDLRERGVTGADLERLRVAADTRLREDLNRLWEVADVNRLRQATDPDRLREVADLDRLREATDLDRLRTAATRNAAVVYAGAQAAQERALAAYGALVARGERVVGSGVVEAAETVNADIEATEATTVGTSTEPAAALVDAPAATPTPADVAAVVDAEPTPVKRTRARSTGTAARSTTGKATTGKGTKDATGKGTAAKATGKRAATSSSDGTPSAKLPKATKRTRPTAE